MQTRRNYLYKCIFGRNLHYTDGTFRFSKSGCLILANFEKIKSSFFYCSWIFKFSCSVAPYFDVGVILYLLQCRYKNKNIRMRTVKQCTEMDMEWFTCVYGPQWWCRTLGPNSWRKSEVCNFLAGTRRTVPLACRSEDLI
jgi:hypothetical protein